jgi:hypothetical protein
LSLLFFLYFALWGLRIAPFECEKTSGKSTAETL